MINSNTIITQIEIDVDTSGTTVALQANRYRKYLMIFNGSSKAIYLRFIDQFPIGYTGMLIDPGVVYEPISVPIDKIYLKSSSGTVKILVVEGKML